MKQNNIQPKTTSTDIEELRKELFEWVDKNIDQDQEYGLSPVDWGRVFNFFAPHLSNKSELKKEAVREFVEQLTLGEYQYSSDKMNVGIFERFDTDKFKVAYNFIVAKIKRQVEEYLSSNEKNSKGETK